MRLRLDTAVPVLLIFACLIRLCDARDPVENTQDFVLNPHVKSAAILEGGTGFAIGSDLGLQPQLGGYFDFAKSWQLGAQARVVPNGATSLYDYLPETSLQIRKLWLGDEDSDPIRNSEYFCLSLGTYFGYGFHGGRIGIEPLGAVSLGKYWMPFDNLPFGLDLSLELSRYLSGHRPGRSELMFITTGINVFYELP